MTRRHLTANDMGAMSDDLRALLEDLRAHFEPKADVEYDDGSPKPNAAKRFLDRIDEELEAQ